MRGESYLRSCVCLCVFLILRVSKRKSQFFRGCLKKMNEQKQVLLKRERESGLRAGWSGEGGEL